MKSAKRVARVLPVLLGAVLMMSGPVYSDEPKAKETPAAEKSQKAEAMKKTMDDKAHKDKRDIQEETAKSQKENIRLGEPKK